MALQWQPWQPCTHRCAALPLARTAGGCPAEPASLLPRWQEKFMNEAAGKEMTVAEYFLLQYNIK